jgi:alanyl-tRNA synthetase
VLDRTNFYSEMGGQVSDTGLMMDEANESDFVVQNVKKSGPFILHVGLLQRGEIKVGDQLGLNYHEEVNPLTIYYTHCAAPPCDHEQPHRHPSA